MRMNTSNKPRSSGRLPPVSLLVLAVAMSALVLVQGGVRAQGTFEPVKDAELSDYHTDVNADIISSFALPKGDYNYGELILSTPLEFFPPSPPPLGAKVGELDYLVTLGLLNGPCNTPLPPHFDLYWASTDTSDTITFEEQFLDSDGNGLHDGIDRYPDFLTRILPGITPVQRMYGYANVGGADVTINFVVYEAGALPGYPAAWGRPSVTVLNDMGDPAAVPTPSPITDFCTPVSLDTITFGLSQDNPATDISEAGYEVRRNPHWRGTYTFCWYAESLHDADGDGIENCNDTCPYDANKGDFRKSHLTGGGDGAAECAPDEERGSGDGIDCACDPDPNLPGGAPIPDLTHCWPNSPGGVLDCDDDGFDNRGDNCPLVPNPDQADADADCIGDACDNDPNTPDGDTIQDTQASRVDIIGLGPAEDSDGDEFHDYAEAYMGTDRLDGCPDDPSDDAWPPDITMDTVVDIFDAILFLNAFPSSQCFPPYTQRLDFSPDGVIDIFDALTFLDHFPSACTNTEMEQYLHLGWSQVCYVGKSSQTADAVASIAEHLHAAYRLRPDDTFDRYVPGRPDLNTMTTMEPFDALFMLITSDDWWNYEMTQLASPAVNLSDGWNSICYTGETMDVGQATADWGEFTVLYRLDPVTKSWCRHFPDRPEISNCTVLNQYDAVSVLAPGGIDPACGPAIPGTYSGTVTIDGQPAPVGTVIRVWREGIQFGQATVSEAGQYAVNVPEPMPSSSPCFWETSGPLTFTCDGAVAQETADYAGGLQALDLTCVVG